MCMGFSWGLFARAGRGIRGMRPNALSLLKSPDENQPEFVETTDDFAVSSAPFAETSEQACPMTRDALDRDLIALLQANARESTANLARQLGVARTTVVARLARLERDGVIVGYTVRLGLDAQRPQVRAHVGISLEPRRGAVVVARLQAIPELLQLSSVSGEFDYIAILRAESTARLDVLLDEIGQIDGVLRTTSSVVLALRVDRGS